MTKNWDNILDIVTARATDKGFLKALSKWLFELSGNVNAAQRLNAIAIRTKEYDDSSEARLQASDKRP